MMMMMMTLACLLLYSLGIHNVKRLLKTVLLARGNNLCFSYSRIFNQDIESIFLLPRHAFPRLTLSLCQIGSTYHQLFFVTW